MKTLLIADEMDPELTSKIKDTVEYLIQHDKVEIEELLNKFQDYNDDMSVVAAATFFKRKTTKMKNWIRCKHFYSTFFSRLGVSLNLIGLNCGHDSIISTNESI